MGEDQIDTPAGTFFLVEEMSYAPENSFTASLDYARPLSNGLLSGRVGYNYQDESSTSVKPRMERSGAFSSCESV